MSEKQPMTKQRLSSYISLRMEVDNQLERLERLKSQEQFPSMEMGNESQHMPGNGDRLERAILRRMEFEKRAMPKIERNRKEMARIEDAIDEMPDPLEREVLRLRYIDGDCSRHMPWKDVSEKLFGDDEDKHMLAVYRLHNKALNNIYDVTEKFDSD